MSETVESRKGARDIKAECKRLGIVPDSLCESCGYVVAVCDHQPAILAYRVALAARDEELAEAKAALEKALEPGAEFDRGFIAGRANTEAEVERMRKALTGLPNHAGCWACPVDTETQDETVCNCGLTAALAAADRKAP